MELRFAVMGTTAHVLVLGGPVTVVGGVRERLHDLDRRWSRFRPDSELSRLNRTTGHHVPASPETALLVRRMVEAWELTAGLCDASVHDAVVAAGYDRTFARLPRRAVGTLGLAAPPPGMAGVTAGDRWVHLPAGTRIDPGAIGKGLAADLAAVEALDAGARGVLVNVGGDLVAAGEAPAGGWRVAVEGPLGGHAATLALHDGAVATTTGARRRWATVRSSHGAPPSRAADALERSPSAAAACSFVAERLPRPGDRAPAEEAHHVIDPITGRPAHRPERSVTVAAAHGWLAEALATAEFLDLASSALRHAGAALEVGAAMTVRDLLAGERSAA